MKIRYEEVQKLDKRLSALLLALILIIAVLNFVNFGFNRPNLMSVSVGLVEVFLIFILLSFLKLKIIVTDEFLEFGFGIFKKKILRKNIISCKSVEIRFGQYFGIGIRLGLNNTILYNTRFGRAVRIKVKGQQRDFVVTTDNPKKLCSTLKH